jgi:hypothetical protein
MSHIKFSKIASVISQKYDQIGDYAYSDKFDKYANSLYKLAQEEVDNEEVKEDDHSKYIIDHPIAQQETENIKEDEALKQKYNNEMGKATDKGVD